MNRKTFLKSIPALGIAGGLSLTACSTGTEVDSGSDLSGDNAIITGAAEREAIAIKTYVAATESGIITSQQVLDTALIYKQHHYEHLGLFNGLLEEVGANIVNLDDFSPDSRISGVSSQEQAVVLAMTVEMEAAQSYFSNAVLQLQGPVAREVMGSIYPIELAHFITLKAALGRNPAVNASTFGDINFG